MPRKSAEHNWSTKAPKFRRSTVAKALELRAQGRTLAEVEKVTGLDRSYVCRLSRDVAAEAVPVQLQTERSRKAAIELLTKEKKRLEERLTRVNAALVRYRGVEESAPSA